MFTFFFGLVALTASIASGILFYVVPQYMQLNAQQPAVKGVTQFSPTVTPTPTDTATLTPDPTDMISIDQTVKQTPTLQPTPTMTEIPTPTFTPSSTQLTDQTFITPTPTPIPSPTPLAVSPTAFPTSTNSTSGLNADIIFNLVNAHRSSMGLALLQKDQTTCNIANQRAPQVYNEIFFTNTMHAGLTAMHLPYWITETIISDDTEQDAVDWWLGDSTHRQVLEGNYTYSCAACSGYSCSQVFTSYIPK